MLRLLRSVDAMQAGECSRIEVYRYVMILSDVSIGATMAADGSLAEESLLPTLFCVHLPASVAAIILFSGFFF